MVTTQLLLFTNVLESVVIMSIVHALHSEVHEILENLIYLDIYLKKTKYRIKWYQRIHMPELWNTSPLVRGLEP